MNKSDVQKIAQLARLELTDEELEKYADQLTQILQYVNTLQEVDTAQVEITAQVTGQTNVVRDDVIEECTVRHELLNQAPEKEGDGVKVKRVFLHD